MINTWRMILLGLFFSHGAHLFAMDKKTESSKRMPLSCSAELRRKIAAINVFVDTNQECKRMYRYSSGRSTLPEYWQVGQKTFMRDVYPIDFQH